MTDQQAPRGASPEDWYQLDFVLGLGANLLPCVPAGNDVRVLKGSALEGKVGKIPSQFNRDGEAHGLKDWQKREILGNEIQLWMRDPRLNVCVRTGPISGVYAIDVDVDDPTTSAAIRESVFDALGMQWPSARTRPNSSKWLLPFRMDASCKKRRIILSKGAAIELLADGQQFVAAGSHSSGVRYQWTPGLPDSLPTLTLDQLNQLWTTLTTTYATATSQPASQTAQAKDYSPGEPTQDQTHEALTSITDEDWKQLLESLRFLLDKVQDNDSWSSVGYALLSLQGTRPIAQLWSDFSKKAVGYVEGADLQWWEAHNRQSPRSDYRHIFKMARDRGMARVADPEAFPPVPPDTGPVGPDGAAGAGLVDVAPPPLPTQPVIQLDNARFSEIIDQIEMILEPHAFVQGPHLVRQTEAHADAVIRRKDDALMLLPVTSAWAMKRTGELAIWQKWSKTDQVWVNTEPSLKHVLTLLELSGWTKLRPLDAIARSPFLRPDGSICDVPGYDNSSRVMYVPSTEFPPVPESPDINDARAALDRIREVFNQFPWKEPASESAFLSHILTEAARVACDCSPMFFYAAPTAGTGKSLIQDMAARIVHGSEPALRPWVGDGDEIRKSLYASLLAGDRSLWFDNVPDGLKTRSPELCAFITSPTWKDRKLGESATLGVPNKCVLVASGNNITPTGDLARRSLVIRLDANTERLSQRVFKIPEGQLRPYIAQHRPQMLIDALTVIKAFHALKDIPPMPVPLASFGAWSHFCRDPLIWLGLPDPVATQNETDDESSNIGNIFERLHQQFGDHEFTSLDIARLVNGMTDSSGELANELVQNGCKEPNSALKVGYWLRGYRDRICRGVKLVNAGQIKTGMKWKFIRMHEDLT